MAIPASNNAKPSNAKPSTDSPEVAALRAQLAAAEAARAAAEAKAARAFTSDKKPRPAYNGPVQFNSHPVLLTVTMDDGREISYPFGMVDGPMPGDRAGSTSWGVSAGSGKPNANVTAKVPNGVMVDGHKVQVSCNLTVLS